MPEYLPILHLLASRSSDVLACCRAQAGDKDTVVLIGDGVLLLASPVIPESIESERPLACLEADVNARGLGATADVSGIERLKDSDMVRLMTQHQHCLTWK